MLKMVHWIKSSYLLRALLVSSMAVVSASASQEQGAALPFDAFLHKDCEMNPHWSIGRTILVEDFVFEPVIALNSRASIKIKDEFNNSLPLNLSGIPLYLPMSGRFDLESNTFKIFQSPIVSYTLTYDGVSDTNRSKELTFANGWMSSGNCTNGLPYYNYSNTNSRPALSSTETKEVLLLSSKDGGFSSIEGSMGGGLGRDLFAICNDGGIPAVRKGYLGEMDDCQSVAPGVPHLLTFSRDSEKNETKVNGTNLRDPHGIYNFLGRNYTVVYCLYGCPRATELSTPPGNATRKGRRRCIYDRSLEGLVVALAVVFFTLMIIDITAMVHDYIRRRFFPQHFPQLNPEDLQWHLNVRPLPWAWQVPPALPERPPPELPEVTLRKRAVVEEEVEDAEDSD